MSDTEEVASTAIDLWMDASELLTGYEGIAFHLVREEDVSGVSGEGVIAIGMCAPEPNGRAVLMWMTDVNSVAVYGSLEELEEIHGHGGSTRVVEGWPQYLLRDE